jgi:NADPH-dependent 2,4-dienoyl-CoA reductase/sulfur reductase-like enzyme
METLGTIAVVGASLAGLRAVETLRSNGFSGRLLLVGAERHRPYDRPPLSKEVLRGEWGAERTALTKPERFDALGLELRLGCRARGLDPRERTLELEGSERIRYDGLILASGARPRTLPGAPPLEGIYVLRTLDDAVEIASRLDAGPRVAVVGAGFIGSEVAASCRARGLEVTLIEALPVPLAQALGETMGELCAALHRDHGVRLHCGVAVTALEGSGRVERLRLSDGRTVQADCVVVGIGVAPDTQWLASSGLELRDGVVCDATLATSAPGVVAAGDVARWWNPLFGESMRVEHWTNAVEQGVAAAKRLLASEGAAEPFANVPFFWSDQYDLKIQLAGNVKPDDRVHVVSGSLEERRFLALYEREQRLVGALAFNRPRQLMACRKLIGERVPFEEAAARMPDPL